MLDQFQLVMHAGPSPGKTFIINNPELILGRDLRNSLIINDKEVSRKHCRLSAYENGIYVEDLGSTNGTFINGQQIHAPSLLSVGDILKIGETVTLVMEEIIDQSEKTVIASSSPSYIPPAVQAKQPEPTPHITQTPPPHAAYVSPPEAKPIAKSKRETVQDKPAKAKALILTIIIMLVVLAIVIGAFLLYVDRNFLWCQYFGWLIKGC